MLILNIYSVRLKVTSDSDKMGSRCQRPLNAFAIFDSVLIGLLADFSGLKEGRAPATYVGSNCCGDGCPGC
jgi:hypothetical protein